MDTVQNVQTQAVNQAQQGSRKHLQPQRDKGPFRFESLQLERINEPNILEYTNNNNWSSGITKAARDYLRM